VTGLSGTELKQRLAAILAADVAGYSRLMAADERATVAALDAARKVFRSQIESNGVFLTPLVFVLPYN
jgi:adenylate cyclase